MLNKERNNIPKGCSDSSLAEQFNGWITHVFRDKAIFDDNRLFNASQIILSGHYERHLYLVTMQFQRGLGAAKTGSTLIRSDVFFHSIYKGWYLSLCDRLLGAKFHKKPIRQPFSMAFLDVEGTRYHRPALTFQLPHIHALLLVPPNLQARFEMLYKSGIFSVVSDSRIDLVDIRPFRNKGRSAEPMMTYAAKYARDTLIDDRMDKTWMVYPDLDAETYPFYRESILNELQRPKAA